MAIPSPQVVSTVDTVSDQRLDIDGATWQLSTNTNESVTLYSITSNAGTSYKIGYLKERPAEANFYSSNAAPAISGLTLVTTLGGIDANTKFYVDYDRAFILLHSSFSGSTTTVTYKGIGSIQKAKDINEAIRAANFANEKYLGGQGSAPTVDANGTSLGSSQEGILYFDNTSNKLKVWDGSAWADATSAVDGVMNTTEVSGSGSTGATPNHWYAFVDDASLQTVYLNGIRLIANQDYRSVNSNSSTSHMSSGTASHIYFVSATEDSDVISMTALGTVSAISVVPAGGGTFTGDVSLDTDSKLKQKGAFMQSSTHQAMVVGG